MTDLVLSDQMVADWARTAITTSASAHVVILAGEVQRLRAQLATVTAQRDSYYERGLAMAGERLLAEAEREQYRANWWQELRRAGTLERQLAAALTTGGPDA